MLAGRPPVSRLCATAARTSQGETLPERAPNFNHRNGDKVFSGAMPLLHQDTSRAGGGERPRSLVDFIQFDHLGSESSAISKAGHRDNDDWHWESPDSPPAALTPRALVPAACFPPRHTSAYNSYSESARPGATWDIGSGDITDLVASLKALTVPSKRVETSLQLRLKYDTYDNTNVNTNVNNNINTDVGTEIVWQSEPRPPRNDKVARRASFCGVSSSGRNGEVVRWSGVLPARAIDSGCGYSPKVFLGGLPWDISETALMAALDHYQPVRVEWPGREQASGTPRGFAYVTFENEGCVRSLLAASRRDGQNWYYRISSRKTRYKDVEVIPWAVSDSYWVVGGSTRLESSRTVFIGALHGMLSARALADIFNDLFQGVVYAAIDTDKNKYPIGSGRVTFNNVHSYVRAISANYVEIRTEKFIKKVQIDPYLEDSMCSVCNLRQGPYFCRVPACFNYFCRSCWVVQHPNDEHKPLMRFPKGSNSSANADVHMNGSNNGSMKCLTNGSSNGSSASYNGPNGHNNGPNGHNGTNGYDSGHNGHANGHNGHANEPNGYANGPSGHTNGSNGLSNGSDGHTNGPNGLNNGSNRLSNGTNVLTNGTTNGHGHLYQSDDGLNGSNMGYDKGLTNGYENGSYEYGSKSGYSDVNGPKSYQTDNYFTNGPKKTFQYETLLSSGPKMGYPSNYGLTNGYHSENKTNGLNMAYTDCNGSSVYQESSKSNTYQNSNGRNMYNDTNMYKENWSNKYHNANGPNVYTDYQDSTSSKGNGPNKYKNAKGLDLYRDSNGPNLPNVYQDSVGQTANKGYHSPKSDNGMSSGQISNGRLLNGPLLNNSTSNGPLLNGPTLNIPTSNGPLLNGLASNGPLSNVSTSNSPTSNGPLLNGPTSNGPLLNGPTSNGPLLNGPTSNGPLLNGPTSNGPLLDGPTSNGPFLNGPTSNGPLLNGSTSNSPTSNGPLLNGLMSNGPIMGYQTQISAASDSYSVYSGIGSTSGNSDCSGSPTSSSNGGSAGLDAPEWR